ncbi:hypothetical protein [Streptomyces sp. ODS28]|uniref:hypothetical protein n=1 Tax=Streptomyces sp. ODS28 TaxID=3136688 RepID=UPI0031EBBD86
MKIRFMLLNAYAVGGTVRTVVNQANALADAGHDVEIISVRRGRETPPSRCARGSDSARWSTTPPSSPVYGGAARRCCARVRARWCRRTR